MTVISAVVVDNGLVACYDTGERRGGVSHATRGRKIETRGRRILGYAGDVTYGRGVAENF